MLNRQTLAGSNITTVKSHNIRAVLLALLHHKDVSRSRLAELTGLSTTTITNLQYLRQFHNDVKISNLVEGNSRKLTVLEVLIPILGRFRPHCGVNFITSLAQKMAFNFGEGIESGVRIIRTGHRG